MEPWEIENLRRSVGMLTPGMSALDRERALDLLGELAATRSRLDHLSAQLRALVADLDGPPAGGSSGG